MKCKHSHLWQSCYKDEAIYNCEECAKEFRIDNKATEEELTKEEVNRMFEESYRKIGELEEKEWRVGLLDLLEGMARGCPVNDVCINDLRNRFT